MKYLFDTDALTFLYDDQRQEHLHVITKLESLKNTDLLFVSVLSIFELEYSYANAEDSLKRQQIRNTIDDIKNSRFITLLPLEAESARIYCDQRGCCLSDDRSI